MRRLPEISPGTAEASRQPTWPSSFLYGGNAPAHVLRALPGNAGDRNVPDIGAPHSITWIGLSPSHLTGRSGRDNLMRHDAARTKRFDVPQDAESPRLHHGAKCRFRAAPVRTSLQLSQHRLRLFDIRRVEAFAETAVDRLRALPAPQYACLDSSKAWLGQLPLAARSTAPVGCGLFAKPGRARPAPRHPAHRARAAPVLLVDTVRPQKAARRCGRRSRGRVRSPPALASGSSRSRRAGHSSAHCAVMPS